MHLWTRRPHVQHMRVRADPDPREGLELHEHVGRSMAMDHLEVERVRPLRSDPFPPTVHPTPFVESKDTLEMLYDDEIDEQEHVRL